MKPAAVALVMVGIVSASVSVSRPVFAQAQPRLIPRSQSVARPIDDVFATLKRFFSDAAVSRFQLVSADDKTHTLVAKQAGIDNAAWAEWAFCEAGPMQMIYRYADGSVELTVKLSRTTKRSTFVSVIANFIGTYTLGSQQEQVACVSKGALEPLILAAAGAAPGK